MFQVQVLAGELFSGGRMSYIKWTGWGASGENPQIVDSPVHSPSTSSLLLQLGSEQGNYGVKEIVTVTPNVSLNFHGWVNFQGGGGNWSEVLLYPYSVTQDRDIDNAIICAPFIVWKGLCPTFWNYFQHNWYTAPTHCVANSACSGWMEIAASISSPTGFVTVVYKLGGFTAGTMAVDAYTLG